MNATLSRTTHAQAILGPELNAQLPNIKVLLVGAGGIGCELLKNIVLAGFGKITLLDLDTIDLSNLNRQFLFRKKDVKQSKALVAAQTASHFNPNVRIDPIHGNIKEPQFDVDWFSQFDIVLNALDNLDARRHVNKMCIAAQVPLVESGTAGYLGQVQPLLKDRTECFDCVPKPTPKSFPVCTIRSTPSQPIHCIVWSKSYLMGQLFGEDEDATGELDEAEQQGENKQEIESLRKEVKAFNDVRIALRKSDNAEAAAKLAFQKVFNSDIQNLLSMSDMWRSREPPTPLDFDTIMNGTFVLKQTGKVPDGNVNGNTESKVQQNGAGLISSKSNLKDQRELSLKESLDMFVSSVKRLSTRLQAGEETISFDKDDDDTLDFVTASSNLRSAAYGIDRKTRWEIKEMAGNIIPAIATTNAIISGLIVLQALHIIRKSYDKLKNVHIQLKPAVPLSAIQLSPPSSYCGICRDTYTTLRCDTTRATLGDVVQGLAGEREVSVYEDKRLLCDPDFDDNNGRTLASLNVNRGSFLSIVDEDGELATLNVAITNLPPNHMVDEPPFLLPVPLPELPQKAKPAPAPLAPQPSLKRSAPDDDSEPVVVAPSPKSSSSPRKRRRLEEDGLILLDDVDEKAEDDVIAID